VFEFIYYCLNKNEKAKEKNLKIQKHLLFDIDQTFHFAVERKNI
jgi:hypothetical protein